MQVKEQLQEDLDREPTDVELAEATNMSAAQVKKCLEVGRAARNKLIKVRIILSFTIFLQTEMPKVLFNA